MRRPRTWAIGVIVVAVLAIVAGPFLYINVIKEEAPDRLELSEDAGATPSTADLSGGKGTPAAAGDGIAGVWKVTAGSQVGYRITEVLFGQDTEGVGRTSAVTGSMTIEGLTISAARFEADLTTVQSDESRRDNQFHGRIMNTDAYPTASFTLSQPVTLDEVPPPGAVITREVTGELAVRGKTKRVTFPLHAQRDAGGSIKVNGSIPFTLDDFDIPDPSNRAASVQDLGEIEFLVVFARA